MAADSVEVDEGPLPRIFEVDENAFCVVVLKLEPERVIDITIHLNDLVPNPVIAASLRRLADDLCTEDHT